MAGRAGRKRPIKAQMPAAATRTAPTRMTRPCAATANASASPFGMPPTIKIAAPAPAWVAAPAGAIGSDAEAADAQRKASASVNEPPTASAFRSTNTATPRSAHETEMRTQAWDAERRQAVCSRSQRPTRVEEVEHRQRRGRQGARHEDGVQSDPDAARAGETTCSPHATRYREVFEEPGDPIEGQRSTPFCVFWVRD